MTMEYKRIKNPWIGKQGYNCIGCAPHNPIGLHMHFYAADNEELWGEWQPTADYQSWEGVVHGGIQSLMLDEAAEWWLNMFRQTAGVTSRLDVRFLRPALMVDGPLRVRARHVKDLRNYVFLRVDLLNQRDEVCSTAEVVYLQYPKEKALSELGFSGCELEP